MKRVYFNFKLLLNNKADKQWLSEVHEKCEQFNQLLVNDVRTGDLYVTNTDISSLDEIQDNYRAMFCEYYKVNGTNYKVDMYLKLGFVPLLILPTTGVANADVPIPKHNELINMLERWLIEEGVLYVSTPKAKFGAIRKLNGLDYYIHYISLEKLSIKYGVEVTPSYIIKNLISKLKRR